MTGRMEEPSELQGLAGAVKDDHLLQALSAIQTLRTEALSAIAKLKTDVEEQEKALVGMARRGGHTWQEIAEALGMNSRQAAHFRYGDKR